MNLSELFTAHADEISLWDELRDHPRVRAHFYVTRWHTEQGVFLKVGRTTQTVERREGSRGWPVDILVDFPCTSAEARFLERAVLRTHRDKRRAFQFKDVCGWTETFPEDQAEAILTTVLDALEFI